MMSIRVPRALTILTLGFGMQGCGVLPMNAYTNEPGPIEQDPILASTRVPADHRGQEDVMVILALSGGGSRAAYFSSKVMYELDGLDILEEVDAIASVSGGSLAAAYYAVTEDVPGPDSIYRRWDGKETRTLKKMERNYIGRWFGRWFWPHNVARFWFTKYDRTDIMAQTFADSLFDRRGLGQDYKLEDLNPERPYLVLNATNATRGTVDTEAMADATYDAKSMEVVTTPRGTDRSFGEPFRFTQEYFESIDSDIGDYSLARAVMATATFPAVFNYMTLRDYSQPGEQYLHVFDGGTHDNQGLTAVQEILLHSREMYEEQGRPLYDKVIVILVDVHTGQAGVSSKQADGRAFIDFLVDTNFIDATDSLLFANREERVEEFYEQTLKPHFDADKTIFYHITFDQLKDEDLKGRAKNVPTSFSLSDENAGTLRDAGTELINMKNSLHRADTRFVGQGISLRSE